MPISTFFRSAPRFASIVIFSLLFAHGSVTSGQRRNARRASQPSQQSSVRPTNSVVGAPITDERWVNIYGGTVFQLFDDVANPRTVYATTYRGIYVSRDNGRFWELFFTPADLVEQIAFAQSQNSPNVMYVSSKQNCSANGCSPGSIYRTDDGGKNWRNISAGIISGPVGPILVDPTNANVVYVSTYRSRDGGKSWAVFRHSATDLEIDPTNPEHLVVETSPPQESFDGGETWQTIDVNAIHPARDKKVQLRYGDSEAWSWIYFHPHLKSMMFGMVRTVYPGGREPYELASQGRFVLSTDGGKTWSDISIKIFKGTEVLRSPISSSDDRTVERYEYPRIRSLFIDKDRSNTIYAGTTSGLFLSSDTGHTWKKVLEDEVTSVIVSAGIIYAAQSRGVVISTNNGLDWLRGSFGLPHRVAGGDRGPNLGLIDDSSTIYLSQRGGYESTSDSGFSWDWHYIVPGAEVPKMIPTSDGSIFLHVKGNAPTMGTAEQEAAARSKLGPILGLDSEHLIKWSPQGSGSVIKTSIYPHDVAISASNDRIIYIKDRTNKLYKSEDGGVGWRLLHSFSARGELRLAISPKSPNILYAFGFDDNTSHIGPNEPFLSSVDGGESWRDVGEMFERTARPSAAFTPGMDDGIFKAVSIVPDPNEPTTVWLATEMSIYKSGDAGMSWARITSKNALGKINAVWVSDGTPRVLYASIDLGVLRSKDDGRSWRLIGLGLNGDTITSLIAKPGLVVGQGRHGIYRLSDLSLGWAGNSNNLREGDKPTTPVIQSKDEAKPVLETKTGLTVTGTWIGEWQDNRGDLFGFELTMKEEPDGKIRGTIQWTLRATKRRDLTKKIGLTATEHFTGTLDAGRQVLSFRGFRKDDPNGIIGLDNYKIRLSADGKTMMGETESGGTWEGRFFAAKKN